MHSFRDSVASAVTGIQGPAPIRPVDVSPMAGDIKVVITPRQYNFTLQDAAEMQRVANCLKQYGFRVIVLNPYVLSVQRSL